MVKKGGKVNKTRKEILQVVRDEAFEKLVRLEVNVEFIEKLLIKEPKDDDKRREMNRQKILIEEHKILIRTIDEAIKAK